MNTEIYSKKVININDIGYSYLNLILFDVNDSENINVYTCKLTIDGLNFLIDHLNKTVVNILT